MGQSLFPITLVDENAVQSAELDLQDELPKGTPPLLKTMLLAEYLWHQAHFNESLGIVDAALDKSPTDRSLLDLRARLERRVGL